MLSLTIVGNAAHYDHSLWLDIKLRLSFKLDMQLKIVKQN